MAKQSIGEIVAQSMQEIVRSDDHKRFFRIAEKACCADCNGACDKGCLCSGKCDKNCKCHKDHGDSKDCAQCGDGMPTMAGLIAALNKVSEQQDQLGLNKSAQATLHLLGKMIAEAGDINDVELLPLLDPENHGTGENSPLADLEDPIEDPNQVKWWLDEHRKPSELKLHEGDVDQALDPELNHDTDLMPDAPMDEMTEPENILTMDGESFEDEDVSAHPRVPRFNDPLSQETLGDIGPQDLVETVRPQKHDKHAFDQLDEFLRNANLEESLLDQELGNDQELGDDLDSLQQHHDNQMKHVDSDEMLDPSAEDLDMQELDMMCADDGEDKDDDFEEEKE